MCARMHLSLLGAGLPGLSVIFDMDGVLLDSEPLWWRAGVAALASVGVALEDEWSPETRGMRTDEALRYWHRKFPWSGKTIKDLTDEIDLRMLEIIARRAEALPGVRDLLDTLAASGIHMAVCSSAPGKVIEAALQSLGLQDSIECVVSAHDELMGKPHPAAYLRCAMQMETIPRFCIAVEDSVSGAIAAKAAQMKVVVVQKGLDYATGLFDFCDARLSSLVEFDEELLGALQKAIGAY